MLLQTFITVVRKRMYVLILPNFSRRFIMVDDPHLLTRLYNRDGADLILFIPNWVLNLREIRPEKGFIRPLNQTRKNVFLYQPILYKWSWMNGNIKQLFYSLDWIIALCLYVSFFSTIPWRIRRAALSNFLFTLLYMIRLGNLRFPWV